MRFGHRPVALCCKNTELRLACFQLPASTNDGRVPYLIPDRHIGNLAEGEIKICFMPLISSITGVTL